MKQNLLEDRSFCDECVLFVHENIKVGMSADTSEESLSRGSVDYADRNSLHLYMLYLRRVNKAACKSGVRKF